MSIFELLWLLPEAALLSTFPFIFYRIARGEGISLRGGCSGALVCIISGMVVLVYYFGANFGSGMSGGGAGSALGNRLLHSAPQVAISVIVFPAAAALLAIKEKGTLGLWVFAMWAGFLSFWTARGWFFLAEIDWGLMIAFTFAGGLCGLAAGLFLARGSQPQQRSRKVLLWSGVGVIFAATGMIAGWLSLNVMRVRGGSLSSVDPLALLEIMVIVAVVWLCLSTVAAFGTGYIKRNSRPYTSES
jgi:hypothetical protein